MGQAARSDVHDGRRNDPGFYLIGAGRGPLEAILGCRASLPRRLLRASIAGATFGYLGTIGLLTLAVLALPLLVAWASGVGPPLLIVLGLLAVIPSSDLASVLVNRFVAAVVKPSALPRFQLRDGVPWTLRTMVVVPTLLAARGEIDEQMERLEVHYLANPDGDLRFAILSDWTDASQETMPGDEDLLAAARERIAGLNQRHGPAPDGGHRFFLFHRRRLWNEREGVWMGWERKRGKLHELNRLLRGATDTSFVSPATGPTRVGYVITAD